MADIKFECQFCGGKHSGLVILKEEAVNIVEQRGLSPDCSEQRKLGILCQRAELDNQPRFEGYLGPMYNGCHEKDGEKIVCLRYETQEVYDLLSE